MKKILLISYFFTISLLSSAQTDKVITIEITEPNALTLNVIKKNPSAFGSTDGFITVQIDGGTAAANGSYTVEWRDRSNTLLTTTTAQVFGTGYRTTLNTVGDGTYRITVTDNAYGSANTSNNMGCTIEGSYTLTEPAELFVTISETNSIACHGETGSLKANPSGGVSGTSYEYKWYRVNGGADTLLGPTTQTISNLSVGVYKVEITDDNNISKMSSNFSLVEPDVLSFSSSVTQVSCNGGNDGAINISVSGGTTPYTYKWRTIPSNSAVAFNENEDVTGLLSGTYYLTITDKNGCFINNYASGIAISQPSPLVLSTNSIQNVSVNGGNDGAIAVSVSGGTAPYTYEWRKDGASAVFSTNQNLTNLTEGIYTLTTKDSKHALTSSGSGCKLVQPYTITAPEVLLVNINEQPISCFNAVDGALTATGSGGVQIPNVSYTYQWLKQNGGSFTSIGQSTVSATGLGEGTYKVVITDNNGNQAENTFTISQPTPLNVSFTKLDVLCKGGVNGSINLSVSGGTSGYSYSWTNSNGIEIATTEDVNSLKADNYSVQVKDSRNCVFEQSVVITEPSNALEITLDSSINPTAFQATNGVISTTVSGGTSPYTYQWIDNQNNVVSSSEDINSIGAGSYTLTVKDANFNNTSSNAGCTVSETFILTEPDLLAVTITVNNAISCFEDTNGALQANTTGGTSPYSYKWFEVNESDVKTNLSVSTETITNLGVGLYSVQVTDANNISITTDFNLVEPGLLSIGTIAVTDVLCFNDTTGAIDITVTGGTTPYTYFWSNGATTQGISSITSGTYNVVITDANNCEIKQNNIAVSQPTEALNIDTSTITPLTGFETNDGAIEVVVLGGTAPYTYSWVKVGTTNVLSSNSEIIGLAIGNYQVTITDSNMCQLTQSFQVTQPDELLVQIEQSLFNLCFNDTKATLRAKVTGGVSSYQYSWYHLDDPTTVLGTAISLENIMAGSYGVKVIDNNKIEATGEVTITQPNKLVVNSTVIDVLCFGAQTGSISTIVTGGTGDYTYVWNNGKNTSSVSDLFTGTYTVTVTDANNCSITKEYTVGQPEAPLSINNATITKPLGFGLSNGSIDITVSGGVPSYSYVWYDANNMVLPETSSILANISAGTYKVKATDAHNCSIEKTFMVTEPPLLEVTITSTPINCKGETGSLVASASGGLLLVGSSYTYVWFDSNDSVIGNTATLSTVLTGFYYVIVTDSNGIQKRTDFNLSEPLLLEINKISSTDVLCYGEQTGAIDISVIGGTGNYTYQWSNGANTEDVTSLISGDYMITVTDDNNCSATETITITQPVLYDVKSVSLMRPTALNSDGSISIEMTGGVPPFKYQWFDSSTALIQETLSSTLRTNVLANVPPETYTIIVTDAIGCVHQETYNLANPGELIADIEQIQDVSCFNASDGQLRVNSVGGAGGNVYVWYDALSNTVVGNDSEYLINIPSGLYYVVVSNADGIQEQSAVFTLNQPDIVHTTSASQNLSCYQSNDGVIQLQASGGSYLFEYRMRLNGNPFSAWTSFLQTNTTTINNLSSGNYQLQVRDSNTCNFELNNVIQNIDITITEPDVLEVSSNTIQDVSGFGLSNGSIEVSINGGTLPYVISWMNANGTQQTSTTQVLSNIPAGAYNISVTDAQQCSITQSYIVHQPNLLEVTIDLQNIILCNGDENGSLMALVTGGIPFTSGPPYVYRWFKQGGINSIGNEVSLANRGAGSYYIIVEDQNGNSTQSDVFELTEPEPLTMSLSGQYISCGTGNDWTITTDVQGGTLPYTYSWNTGDNTPNIVNVEPGNYLVIITDAQGCEIIKTYSVQVPQVLDVQETVTQVNCTDACEGKIALEITGGVSPYLINWNTGDTTTSINNLCPGEYSVSVTDQKGCEIILEYILENPNPIIIDLGEDKTLCNNQSHELDISINDSAASYEWTSNNGFTSSSPNVSLTEEGVYTATLTTGLGCIGVDTVEIIKSSTGINSQFLITSQAFAEESIILINTSSPIGANNEWILPSEAQIIEEDNETIILHFNIPGAYEITLRSFQGNCFQDYTKPIIVGEARDLTDIGDTETPFIIDFRASPNPTTGVFVVDVALQDKATVSLRLFSLISNIPIDDRQAHNASEYNLTYNVSLPSGIYFLLLQTAKGSEIRKIIIE